MRKKKEMIGNFKNPGACWEKQPQLVMDHDFRSDAKGRAVPYGIYDPARNQGFVVAGTSHETPAFAVDALTLWWKSYEQRMYGQTGLKVRARLLRKKYEKGEKISAQEMKQLALTRHKTLPMWNYTLRPM